jgi:hypothetical protein
MNIDALLVAGAAFFVFLCYRAGTAFENWVMRRLNK